MSDVYLLKRSGPFLRGLRPVSKSREPDCRMSPGPWDNKDVLLGLAGSGL